MSNPNPTTRRQILRTALLGSGLVGLQALATGLPRALFTDGLPGLDAHAAAPRLPSYLIVLTSQSGEPFNACVPGTYGVEGVLHNPNPEMAETRISLGGVSTSAAAPWAALPQAVLDRTAVIHHRTYQNAHPQYAKVMGLVGSARNRDGNGTEHLPSLIASETAPLLGTVQPAPIRMTGGGEPLTYEGRVVQSVDPSTLADVFAPPEGQEALDLATLRAASLDRMYAIARDQGTPRHRDLIDRLATSREQALSLDEALIERFSLIDGNDARNELRAALTLFLMNVTPVVTLKMAFGGDNHNDAGFARERNETVASFGMLADFYAELAGTPLADRVVVANLGVFGRTLGSRNSAGRDHNLNHHAMMISGAGVGAGVYGGIAPVGRDFGATAIDAATGASVEKGDIPEDETLESAAKTLATVVGVPSDRLDLRIDGGRVIAPAVAG